MSRNPIDVTTAVSINHWELGRDFSTWSNEEQALFLHGMFEGLMGNLGGVYGVQLLAVREHAEREGYNKPIEELVGLLADYLGQADA